MSESVQAEDNGKNVKHWHFKEWQDEEGRRITERCKDPWEKGVLSPRFLGHAMLNFEGQTKTPQGLVVPVKKSHPFQFVILADSIGGAYGKFQACFTKAIPEAKQQFQAMQTAAALKTPGKAPPNLRGIVVE